MDNYIMSPNGPKKGLQKSTLLIREYYNKLYYVMAKI